jgi:hypothetical protein
MPQNRNTGSNLAGVSFGEWGARWPNGDRSQIEIVKGATEGPIGFQRFWFNHDWDIFEPTDTDGVALGTAMLFGPRIAEFTDLSAAAGTPQDGALVNYTANGHAFVNPCDLKIAVTGAVTGTCTIGVTGLDAWGTRRTQYYVVDVTAAADLFFTQTPWSLIEKTWIEIPANEAEGIDIYPCSALGLKFYPASRDDGSIVHEVRRAALSWADALNAGAITDAVETNALGAGSALAGHQRGHFYVPDFGARGGQAVEAKPDWIDLYYTLDVDFDKANLSNLNPVV